MVTVVIGVRHKSAPIEIREKLSFAPEEIPDALREMLTYPGIQEGAILNTCNRTEVYATVHDTEVGIRSLKAFLSEYKQFDYNRYMTYAFILLHEDAVMHLFRVASGLDSLVLGEGQIMAQVKDALKTAMEVNSSGEVIEKIFKSALSVGKAVRSQTGIANRDNSVSRAAFAFVAAHYPNFLNQNIAVIGAGKMAEILITSLRAAIPEERRRPEQIVLVNRSLERVKALSSKYGFPGYGWESMESVLQHYDVLFVATSSASYVLVAEMFQGITGKKIIVDISVPRNVDPAVAEIAGMSLFNTDDLSGYSGYTGENRVRLIKQAHQIIEREYQRYYQWYIGRSAAPMITQLRARVEDIRRNEVAEIEAMCPHVQKSCSMIDDLSRLLVNKILHDPTVRLRSTPELDEIYHQAQLLSHMFNLPAISCGSFGSAEDVVSRPVVDEPVPSNVLLLQRARKP